jgi:predicted regulator of Ras-like GTPase activity (Roadblock/LC7/MglB family)
MNATESQTQRITNHLRKLKARSKAIVDCWLASADGLMMANANPISLYEDFISPRSAAMMSMAECIAETLKIGPVDRVCICATSSHIQLTSIGSEAILTIFLREATTLDPLSTQVRRTEEQIKEILQSS